MQIIINISEKEYKQIIKGNWIGEAMAEIFENGTPLPDNPTNGDMIKALFPYDTFTIVDQMNSRFVEHHHGTALWHHFNLYWWNAPYERSTDADSN